MHLKCKKKACRSIFRFSERITFFQVLLTSRIMWDRVIRNIKMARKPRFKKMF